MDLRRELEKLRSDITTLEKYGATDFTNVCEAKIRQTEFVIEQLETATFQCPDCRTPLIKEERIYLGVSSHYSSWYSLWDTYICRRCGFFTWDEDSERRIDINRVVVLRDPRYRGTTDGHPKFDSDNRIR
jgi:predicted RNA-binding Zn-ribbon protein involved in translation (DUF1610 family)